MGSPTDSSPAAQNPGPRTRPGAIGARVTPAATPYSSDERPSRGPWPPSEAPPTGALTAVLGEMAFYYGACWLHYRSSASQRPQGEKPPRW